MARGKTASGRTALSGSNRIAPAGSNRTALAFLSSFIVIASVFLAVSALSSPSTEFFITWTTQSDFDSSAKLNVDVLTSPGDVRLDKAEEAWAKLYGTGEGMVNALAVYNGKLYAATGAEGKIFSYDGSNWETAYDSSEENIYALKEYNGKLYAGTGPDALLLEYDGTSWRTVYNASESGILAFAIYEDMLYMATSGEGYIYKYDGSDLMLSYNVPEDKAYSMIEYKGKLYVSGYGSGNIYVYDGFQWLKSTQLSSVNGAFAMLEYDSNIFLVSDPYGFVYTYDAKNWTLNEDLPESAVYALAVYNKNLYSAGKNIYLKNNDTNAWDIAFAVSKPLKAMAAYNGKLYAAGDGGIIYSYSSGYKSSGKWNKVYDALNPVEFSALDWESSEPEGTSVKIRIKAAGTEAGLASAQWSDYYTIPNVDISGLEGRYAEIEAVLETTDAGITPALSSVNLAYTTPSMPALAADLQIESAEFKEKTLVQGTDAELSVSVKNSGNAAAENFIVALYKGDASGQGLLPAAGAPIAEKTIALLASGSSAELAFTGIETAGLSGLVNYTIIADSGNNIPESNEENNSAEVEIVVSKPSAEPASQDYVILLAIIIVVITIAALLYRRQIAKAGKTFKWPAKKPR